jgi:hypothetical protein
MGMDTLKLSQLAALFANQGQQYAAHNPGQQTSLAGLQSSAQGAISAEAEKRAKKEAEKKKKKGPLGAIGSTLGMVAGSMIPGVGPIVGPAIGGALGGALGGSAQSALSGGAQGAMMGAMGGLGGGTAGGGQPSIKPPEIDSGIASGGQGTFQRLATSPDLEGSLGGAMKFRQWSRDPMNRIALEASLRDGARLSPEQIRAMPRTTRRQLEDRGFEFDNGGGSGRGMLGGVMSNPLALYLLMNQMGGLR